MGCIFFNDTTTTEIYTLSLHSALPISQSGSSLAASTMRAASSAVGGCGSGFRGAGGDAVSTGFAPIHRHRTPFSRSEEHTSEPQSRQSLVCRPLVEQKIALNTYRNTYF